MCLSYLPYFSLKLNIRFVKLELSNYFSKSVQFDKKYVKKISKIKRKLNLQTIIMNRCIQ